MLQCVERDAAADPAQLGFSVVSGILDDGNPHGSDTNYASRYAGYFLVPSGKPGNWQFRADSIGASEIEIDGQVVVEHYGASTALGTWKSGSMHLGEGRHFIVYRHEAIAEPGVTRAEFLAPGDANWRPFSAPALTLKAFPLQEGLLLVNKKNTQAAYPTNHAEMVACVEQAAQPTVGWYGFSVVSEISHAVNIHGEDSWYTSHYETYFHVAQAGGWYFVIGGDRGSELEVDGEVVASAYDGGTSATSPYGGLIKEPGCRLAPDDLSPGESGCQFFRL